YANVSRGRIRAKPDTSDPRRSLYHADDVARLAERHAGRRKTETVAAETIQWGDPVLPSAISTIVEGRLYYRGQDAQRWSDHATLEQTAALLWDTASVTLDDGNEHEHQGGSSRISEVFIQLAARAAIDLPALGRSPAALHAEAGRVMSTVAVALAPGHYPDTPVHARLALGWNKPEAADSIRRALVLTAEHELNVSAFAARVTASSGASLAAATLSGLSTLSGPRHGGAWQSAFRLAEQARFLGAREAIRMTLSTEGVVRPFGHQLYPHGDMRARAIMASFEVPPLYVELAATGEQLLGESVNIDFALATMAAAFGLPAEAPLVIFALSRSTGWLAHAMEQVLTGRLIRPRARYTGPPVTP
ncbi:MAG: citrate synthase, partial [Pseudorhodoplanes sp.]